MTDSKKIKPPVEFLIEPPGKLSLDFMEIWNYRELFYFFAWRDIKIKYKQTSLGILWVVLQPLLTVLVFTLFFGRALNVPSAGLPYPVFVFSGLLLWNLFSVSVNNAGNSMLTNAAVIKKIYFPRFIIPCAAVLVSLVDFFIAFLTFVVVLFFYQVNVDYLAILVYWPVAILIMLAGTIGISSGLAALTVKYRDFRYVIPFGLQILLFVSPVIYPDSIVHNQLLSTVLAVNPMYAAINLFRVPLIGSFQGDTLLIAISSTSSIVLFALGIYYFKRTESFFADIA
jgi:lipopolysaccharide transport system permease protein